MRKRLGIIILVLLFSLSTVPAFAASDDAIVAADSLHSLGLFNGTGTDENGNPIYELDRQPTRHEAVTMLVRLLGKEDEAKNGSWNIPFTDVAEWAKPYIGYAYTNKLTFGTSATTFGGADTVTASQYITLVLRALGYSSDTDFRWDAAWELSDELGITNSEYNTDNNANLLRGDVAIISNNALKAKLKDTTTALFDSLNQDGFGNAEIVNRYKATFYENNGLYYEGARIDHGIIEVAYNGTKDLYIQGGDLYPLLVVVSGSYDTKASSNPFLDGSINLYNMTSEYLDGDKPVWDFGSFQYVHWSEYINASNKLSWVEYRYNGNICTLTADSERPDNQVYYQNGMRCVSSSGLNFVSLNDVLDCLNISGAISLAEVENIGSVWSFG